MVMTGSLLVPIIYGTPSIILYIIVINTISRNRKVLSKDFYYIFIFSAVINIDTFVHKFIIFLIPGSVTKESATGQFYLSLPNYICIPFWNKFTAPLMTFVALSSSITILIYSEAIAFYEAAFDIGLIFTTKGAESLYFVYTVVTLTVFFLNLILNSTSFYFIIRLKCRKSAEVSIFVYTLANFALAILCTVVSFLFYLLMNYPSMFNNETRALFHVLSNSLTDIVCLVDPIMLTVFSKIVRKDVLTTLRRITLTRQASSNSPNAIATIGGRINFAAVQPR